MVISYLLQAYCVYPLNYFNLHLLLLSTSKSCSFGRKIYNIIIIFFKYRQPVAPKIVRALLESMQISRELLTVRENMPKYNNVTRKIIFITEIPGWYNVTFTLTEETMTV